MKTQNIKSIPVNKLGQKAKHLLYYFSIPENRDNIVVHKDKLNPTQRKLLKEYLNIDL